MRTSIGTDFQSFSRQHLNFEIQILFDGKNHEKKEFQNLNVGVGASSQISTTLRDGSKELCHWSTNYLEAKYFLIKIKQSSV